MDTLLYGEVRGQIVALLQAARAASARSVNALMTASYWEIGRRIVEFEQKGEQRAEYGETLIKQLAEDLTRQFGRGFGAVNLSQMRRFYLEWPAQEISQTPSEKSPLPFRRLPPASLCPGRPTSGCFRSRTRKPEPSTQSFQGSGLRPQKGQPTPSPLRPAALTPVQV